MAGGKETPRQKMIGMMYLVLTALLALNVSKDVLYAFVVINKGLEQTNQNQQDKRDDVLGEFEAQHAMNPQKTGPFLQKARAISAAADELISYIDELKRHLIAKTEGLDENAPDSIYDLRLVASKDNYDVPTEIMIGSEPATPRVGHFTAFDLRRRIELFRDEAIAQFDPTSDRSTIARLGNDLALHDVPAPRGEGPAEPWETGNFYHLPLAAVVANLSKIQSDIRAAENLAMKALFDQILKKDFKFDTIAARVIPQSNYVLLGEEYTADILLTAYSRTAQPEMVLSDDAMIPVRAGQGKLIQRATSEGLQHYSGKVRLQTGPETYDEFPFAGEYLVARPSVTVSPTEMLVFYRGIANPVKVSAPGFADQDLIVTVDGGNRIEKTTGGAYNVHMSPQSPAQTSVNIAARMPDGSIRPLGSSAFRVKPLPTPYGQIGAVTTSGSMTAADLIARQGIRCTYGPDFMFNLPVSVKSFRMSAYVRGEIIDEPSGSNGWTRKMVAAIERMPRGTKVIFEEIRAEGKDGVTHPLSPIVITIL